MTPAKTVFLKDLWNEAEAAKLASNELALLRYRSNLLGADLRITNFGGGNTSSKIDDAGPVHRPARARPRRQRQRRRHRFDQGIRLRHPLSRSAHPAQRHLKRRRVRRRDGLLSTRSPHSARTGSQPPSTPRCTASSPRPRRPSPPRLGHRDRGQRQRQAQDGRVQQGVRPQDRVASLAAARLRTGAHAGAGGEGKPKMPTASSSAATASSPGAIPSANATSTASKPSTRWVGSSPPMRRRKVRSSAASISPPFRTAQTVAAAILPALRGVASSNRRQIAHYADHEDALDVRGLEVGQRTLRARHQLPRSLPAHPHLPLFVDWKPATEGLDVLKKRMRRAGRQIPRILRRVLQQLGADRFAETARFQPSVVVIPGLGLFGFGKNKKEARITTEFFINAIHVMAGAAALEMAKLPTRCRRRADPNSPSISPPRTTTSRCPVPKPSKSNTGRSKKPSCSACPPKPSSAARSLLIVGGGSGIGREVALMLAKKGAHLVVVRRECGVGEGSCRRSREADFCRNRFARACESRLFRKPCRGHSPHHPAVRRHRRHHQHRRHLPGGHRPGGELTDAQWNTTFLVNVTGNYLLAQRSQMGLRRSEADCFDRAHQFRQRRGVEARQRSVRRKQDRAEPSDPRTGRRA